MRFGLTDGAGDPLGNADRIRFWINDMDNHLHSIGQALGFTYEEGAVIPDGTVAKGAELALLHADPTGPAGAFRTCGSTPARKHSTLDWFDKEFAVVTGPLGQRVARGGPRRFRKDRRAAARCKQLPDGRSGRRHSIGLARRRAGASRRPCGLAHAVPAAGSGASELAGALSTLLH